MLVYRKSPTAEWSGFCYTYPYQYIMWRRFRKIRRRRSSSVTKHYSMHKEAARELILARLEYFNQHYQLEWNRVAIRNQRRCWGSCTSLKNLNFSYKILFLPAELCDYIIVHELCHLVELNHGPRFWALVAETVPHYHLHKKALREIERVSTSAAYLESLKETPIMARTKDIDSVT